MRGAHTPHKMVFILLHFISISFLCLHLLFSLTQVVERELLIKEKEKLYMELKQILARQPGPEVAEQLSIYQQTLKEKTKQMKVNDASFEHHCSALLD